jgi:hypothetical protein
MYRIFWRAMLPGGIGKTAARKDEEVSYSMLATGQ